jgi:hypothetical protein
MAGVTGLEPAASGVTGQRSNRLSYTPGTFQIGLRPGRRSRDRDGAVTYSSPPWLSSELTRFLTASRLPGEAQGAAGEAGLCISPSSVQTPLRSRGGSRRT